MGLTRSFALGGFQLPPVERTMNPYSSLYKVFFTSKSRRTAMMLVVVLTMVWISPAVCDEIHDAAKHGDLAKIKALLRGNPGLVSSTDYWGMTPLHFAATWGHKDVAELLLANHAEVNAKNHDGETPLHYAAIQGDKDVAQLLLANRADPNATDKDGETPLHKAAEDPTKDVAELLLANHAEVNAKDHDGRTPLHDAAAFGHKDVAELLLANHAEVNAKDNDGRTPLHFAAHDGMSGSWLPYKDVAELLLANHGQVNAKDNNGETPLHQAARMGHKKMAELLLANKAEAGATDNHGLTPLQSAIGARQDEVAELLRHSGAQHTLTKDEQATRLGELVVSMYPGALVVKFNQFSGQYSTERLHAAGYNESDTLAEIRELLAAGADPNAIVISGYEADEWIGSGAARTLHQGNPGHVVPASEKGMTLVHYCKLNGFSEAAALLMEHGGKESAGRP
jgi:cytohesin